MCFFIFILLAPSSSQLSNGTSGIGLLIPEIYWEICYINASDFEKKLYTTSWKTEQLRFSTDILRTFCRLTVLYSRSYASKMFPTAIS